MKVYLVFFLLSTAVLSCHYSCSTCASPLYSECLSCADNSNVTVLEDPSMIPSQYWSSLYPTGDCVDTLSTQPNAFGIIFFLICLAALIIFKSKQTFYLFLTIQTFGLFNLVQIAWIDPTNYLNRAFSYFMIFNLMGSGYKSDDMVFIISKNFRLKTFFTGANLSQNIAIIAPFTIIAFVLLVIISIISIKRDRQQKKSKQNNQNQYKDQQLQNQSKKEDRQLKSQGQNQATQKGKQKMNKQNEKQQIEDKKEDKEQKEKGEQKEEISIRQDVIRKRQDEMNVESVAEQKRCECLQYFSKEVLIKIQKILLGILFLMMQETSLVLLISLVFISPTQSGTVAVCVIYLHMLLFMLGAGYYCRLEYFSDHKIMYINFAKKLILPVMVVVPISYQYLLFLFISILYIGQFIIDLYDKLYSSLNRLAVYKILELIALILWIIYYAIQKYQISAAASKTASIAATFAIALFLTCYAVEIPIGIRELYLYFKNKSIENHVQNNQKLQMTEQNIEPDEQIPRNDTLQVINIENDDHSRDLDENIHYQEIIPQNMDQKNTNDEQSIKTHPEVIKTVEIKQVKPEIVEIKEVQPAVEQAKEVQEKADDEQEKKKKKKRKQILDKELRLRYGI